MLNGCFLTLNFLPAEPRKSLVFKAEIWKKNYTDPLFSLQGLKKEEGVYAPFFLLGNQCHNFLQKRDSNHLLIWCLDSIFVFIFSSVLPVFLKYRLINYYSYFSQIDKDTRLKRRQTCFPVTDLESGWTLMHLTKAYHLHSPSWLDNYKDFKFLKSYNAF